MFGIPTRDLNPIYNVPMLGTHKAALDSPLPPRSRSRRVVTNLNLKRGGAPGSGCQAFDVAKNEGLSNKWAVVSDDPLIPSFGSRDSDSR
jgi:hypothetical protein